MRGTAATSAGRNGRGAGGTGGGCARNWPPPGLYRVDSGQRILRRRPSGPRDGGPPSRSALRRTCRRGTPGRIGVDRSTSPRPTRRYRGGACDRDRGPPRPGTEARRAVVAASVHRGGCSRWFRAARTCRNVVGAGPGQRQAGRWSRRNERIVARVIVLGGQMLRREPGAEVLDGSSIFLDEVAGHARAQRGKRCSLGASSPRRLARMRSRTLGRRKTWSSMDALLSGRRTVGELRG